MNVDISKITVGQLFLLVPAVLAFGKVVIEVSKKVNKVLNTYYSKRKGKENKNDMVLKHDIDIKNINSKLDKLIDTVEDFVDNSKKDTMLSQRQILDNIYFDVKEKGYITDRQAKDFDDILVRYEKNNGNGHIHFTVVPIINEMKLSHCYISDLEAKSHYDKYKQY